MRIENRICHKDQLELFESAEFKLYLQINCVRDSSGILLWSESGTKDRAKSPTLVVTPKNKFRVSQIKLTITKHETH